MTLALDTNVIADVLSGRIPRVRDRFNTARASGEVVHVSTVVVEELLFGAKISGRPDHHEAAVHRFLSEVIVQAFEPADAERTAALRAAMRKAGTPIAYADLLIAGQALARGWTIVTHNRRDFDRVAGLAVVDWR